MMATPTQHPLTERCVICATDAQIRTGGTPGGDRDGCPHWSAIEADPSVREWLPVDAEQSIRAQLERLPDSDAITVAKVHMRAVLAEHERRGDELAKLRTAVAAVLDKLSEWQLAAYYFDGMHPEAAAFDAARELILHHTESLRNESED